MAAYQVIFLILIINVLTSCIMGQSPDQQQSGTGICNNVLTGPMGPSGQPGIGLPGVQGPQGMTGRAGDPGSNGIPGVPGQTGLRGEKGDLGQGSRGQTGIQGPKGEQGLDGIGLPGPCGHPGKVGPQGIIGVGQKGDEGQQGIKGNQGESGTSYTAPPMSAFSARKAANQRVTSGNEVIIFNAVEDLDVGNDFNPSTGVFTCPIQGLYYFSFSFLAHPNYNCFIFLEHNGSRKANIYKQASSGHHVMQSQSVILSLQVGDEVKLTADAPTYITYGYNFENVFSGYLIHAI